MKDFKLDNHPKINSGFKAPEGYFDDLSEKIETKLLRQETLTISILRKNKKWIPAVAAIFIVAIGIFYFLKQKTSGNDLDATTAENYVVYQSDISQDDLVMLLNDRDLDKMKVDLKIQNDTLENLILDNEEFNF